MPTYCVIDIDTTLANNDHRASLLCKDAEGVVTQESWDAFLDEATMFRDTLQPFALNAIEVMRQLGYTIVFLTGRNERLRKVTELWLAKHIAWNPYAETLLMRKTTEACVPASVCKRALFEEYLDNIDKQREERDYYEDTCSVYEDTYMFFDDDPHVLDMWRKLGTAFKCPEAWQWMCTPTPSTPELAWNK